MRSSSRPAGNEREIFPLSFAAVFRSIKEGAAVHRLILDRKGKPADYVILDMNPACEKITGFKKARSVGIPASKLHKTGRAPYLEHYGRVGLTGESLVFETFFRPMKKRFSISVSCPQKGYFVCVFSEITGPKEQREAIRRSISGRRRRTGGRRRTNQGSAG